MNPILKQLARSRLATATFWLILLPSICGAIMAGVILTLLLVLSVFVRLAGNWMGFVSCVFFAVGFLMGLRIAWPRFREHWEALQRWRKSG